MIQSGILNPALVSLLCRVRHTNTLVIADRGFPFWPQIETVDISLTDDLPTVLQVLTAIVPNFKIGRAQMAGEFRSNNTAEHVNAVGRILGDVRIEFLPHVEFKQQIPRAIGLIRTGDTKSYANMLLESA